MTLFEVILYHWVHSAGQGGHFVSYTSLELAGREMLKWLYLALKMIEGLLYVHSCPQSSRNV